MAQPPNCSFGFLDIGLRMHVASRVPCSGVVQLDVHHGRPVDELVAGEVGGVIREDVTASLEEAAE